MIHGKKLVLTYSSLTRNNYVVISDYYSKFFEISKLTGTSASSTIKHIKTHFAIYGILEEVISDNGPQFASAEFEKFAKDFEFKHTTSSPRYPQSNGLAERTVQTIKSILKKSLQDKSDPNLALLHLRNIPIDGIGKSPVQLVMGRRTRTLLPTSPKLLQPLYNTDKIQSELYHRQEKQKKYYDRNAKPLEPLKEVD